MQFQRQGLVGWDAASAPAREERLRAVNREGVVIFTPWYAAPMPTVLVVDDDPMVRRMLARILGARGYTVEAVDSGEGALAAVRTRRPDLVLSDVHMNGLSGLEIVERLTQREPGLPVVIMTGEGGVETAVAAFKRGAVDFVTKPFDEARLLSALDAALAPRPSGKTPVERLLVGQSPAFLAAIDLSRRFGRPDINVLLQGETGTGKELFARAIHAASKRSKGPFVPVDCSVLTETLIESELFGYEKGAFTGATATRMGHFERADGGTLFLDEIGNLTPSTQAKLLRVLQERTIERVGGRETLRLDIRVISASNVALPDAVRDGQFRADLYYRLAEAIICPPPLRERGDDLKLLAAHFVERYAAQFDAPARGISPRALESLSRHRWPGNVRELENAIKSAVVLAKEEIGPEHLPKSISPGAEPEGCASSAAGGDRIHLEIEVALDSGAVDLKAVGSVAAEKAERAVLERLVAQGRYSQTELARLLNVDPKTLRAKLRKFGLDPDPSS
jgi:DNA-binding NtrC family response regulator